MSHRFLFAAGLALLPLAASGEFAELESAQSNLQTAAAQTRAARRETDKRFARLVARLRAADKFGLWIVDQGGVQVRPGFERWPQASIDGTYGRRRYDSAKLEGEVVELFVQESEADVYDGARQLKRSASRNYKVDAASGRVLSVAEYPDHVFRGYDIRDFPDRPLDARTKAEFRALWPSVLNAFGVASLDALAALGARRNADPKQKWAALEASWTKGAEKGEVKVDFEGHRQWRWSDWTLGGLNVSWKTEAETAEAGGVRKRFAQLQYGLRPDGSVHQVSGSLGDGLTIERAGTPLDRPAVDALVSRLLGD